LLSPAIKKNQLKMSLNFLSQISLQVQRNYKLYGYNPKNNK
jgi:hypothetical protein